MAMTPDNSALQVFYGTLPLIGTAVLAVWNNNSRLNELSKRMDDLKVSLNKRIDDLASNVNAGFTDVKDRLSKLEDRVSDLERSTRLVRQ